MPKNELKTQAKVQHFFAFYSPFLRTFDILSKIAFKYPICTFSRKYSEAMRYSFIITFFWVIMLK